MSIKTLRFGPLPSAANQSRDKWDKFIDIPPDTTLRIVSMPGGAVVLDTKVTRSFSMDFDPGKYRYMMKKDLNPPLDGSPGRCMRVEGEFLIDVTEAQWNVLRDASPRAARALQTSEGPIWSCKMPGCSSKAKTRLAAFLHECRDHFGIDPITEPHKVAEATVRGLEVGASLTGRQRQERGRLDSDILKEMSDRG